MRISILAFLLLLQSFMACQRSEETTVPMTASIGFPSIPGGSLTPEAEETPATNLIFQSTDGGQTWQDVSNGLPATLEVRRIFATGEEIFLGTANGLYRSSTHAKAPKWRKEQLLEERITEIFPGRAGLYVCNYEKGFFQEIIAGTGMWKPVYTTLKDKSVRTVLETPDGSVFVGCDNGIFKSTDKGQTWKQVFDKGMVLNLVEANGVLISGGSEGVLRSTDGGEHWESVLDENILAKKTGRLNESFVTILGTKDATKINPEGITSRLRISHDGGKTWQRMEPTLPPVAGVYDLEERLSDALDLYDIVQVGEYLFCSFDTGIFRSADKGKSWEPVLRPSKKDGVYNFAVSGKVIYALVTTGGC
ncbi:MAG: exo-alpha-sialidase [Saprospiraceae bacterium]|nr:exo-alpha-sialidase [Saprospiraceae bacterium]